MSHSGMSGSPFQVLDDCLEGKACICPGILATVVRLMRVSRASHESSPMTDTSAIKAAPARLT